MCRLQRKNLIYDIKNSIFAMSTKDKLIERFKQLPSDFTFDELVRLFSQLGFELDNKGATSGSRVVFVKEDMKYILHKPHPVNTVKKVYLNKLCKYLRKNKLI